jgi:hypothetical protein
MDYLIETSLFAVALLICMLLLLELGRRVGRRRMESDGDGARAGLAAVDGAVFALLGLLIAFTFSGAAARFDTRRQLIVAEANAIGTAYLRLDMLPEKDQPPLRDTFRKYLDARLLAYKKLPDISAARAELAVVTNLQGELWREAVAACHAYPPATMLLLPALNVVFEVATTRTMAAQMHPPKIVFGMLAGLALASSLLAGYGTAASRTRSWIHMVAFTAMMALAVYVILDMEFPRFGLIRVDAFDQALIDVRASMQ